MLVTVNGLKLTTIAITQILSMALLLWVLIPWFKKQNGRRWAWALLIAGIVFVSVYIYWGAASGTTIAEMGKYANGSVSESSRFTDVLDNVYYLFIFSFAVFYRRDKIGENVMFMWLTDTARFIGIALVQTAAAALGVGSNYFSVSQPAQLPRWALMVAAMLAITYGLLRACCWLMVKLEGSKKTIYIIDAFIAAYLVWYFWPSYTQADPSFGPLIKGFFTGNSKAVYTLTLMILEDAAVTALAFAIIVLVTKNLYDEKERAALSERSAVLYDYIVKSQDLRDEAHKLRHDTQNQMLAVKTLLDDGETEKAAEMANMLSGAVAVLPRVDYCENTLANAVLANKEPLCRETGIKTEYRVSLPEKTGIADADLVSALANLLDNAIHACRKLPEGGEKSIELTAVKRDDIIVVECLNSADPGEIRELSKPKKPKKDGHGWGLRILRDMAGRYDGSFKITDSGSMVDAVLMLKEKESASDQI
jgi:hypothetical protein